MPRSHEIPGVDDVRQLPADLSMVVPPEWEDQNGHVNVQYYQRLYELGGWAILERAGIDVKYLGTGSSGFFDLEHHIRYLAEIHVGETVSVHNRMLGCDHKRFHGMLFIVNDSRSNLSCTIEYLSIHVDSALRRTAPFPQDMARRLDQLRCRHAALQWPAPVCGVMNP